MMFSAPRLFQSSSKRCHRLFSSHVKSSSDTSSKTIKFAVAASVLSVGGYYILRRTYFPMNEQKASPTSLDPENFVPFKLKEVLPVSHNTKTFRFSLPSEEHVLGLPVASCVLTKTDSPNSDQSVIRPYTPTTDEYTKGYFDLVVKKYPNGLASSAIHDLKVGDEILVKGPITKISYVPNMKKEIGMLAGGTGITPMLQVIRKIVSNPEDKTKVSLIFGNIEEQDILLRNELDDLAKKHPNFKVFYTLDKPPSGWSQGSGHINEEMVKQNLPPPSQDSLIMVCGPPGMVAALAGPKGPNYTQGEIGGLLKKIGYSEVFKF